MSEEIAAPSAARGVRRVEVEGGGRPRSGPLAPSAEHPLHVREIAETLH